MAAPIANARIVVAIEHLRQSAAVKLATAGACTDQIIATADLIAAAFKTEGKLLLCGNGGSAADCQHMAAEFTSRLSADFLHPGLPALALTTDTSFLTAYANDFDFDGIFARQVQALGKSGDVLLAISTSGKSRNVVRAAMMAKEIGIKVIVLTGRGETTESGKLPLLQMADAAVCIPSDDTMHIQEAHLAVEHIICHLVERAVFKETP